MKFSIFALVFLLLILVGCSKEKLCDPDALVGTPEACHDSLRF